jgi:hypothetical protein
MVKIGSFTINAQTAENLQVTGMVVNLVGTTTNYTNLTVKDGSAVVGSPVGNPQAVNNISVNTTVAAGTSKTFEVYADVQSATTTIQADMSLTYRGVQSNVNVSSSATGVVTTPALGAITSVTVNPSPVSQYVVGGTSNALIASYVIKSTTAPMTITKMTFNSVDIAGATTSQSIQSVTVGGVTAQFVNGVAEISGLNILVPGNNTGATVNATVNYACFTGGNVGSGCNLSTSQASTSIKLVNVEGTTGNTTISTTTSATSAPMLVVASKPTLTSAGANLSGLLNGNVKVGEVTVAADAAGAVEVTKITWSVTPTTPVAVASAELRESGSVVPGATCTAGVCTFATGYQIAAGTSKTFSLHTVVSGVAGAAGTASVSTSVTAAGFMWNDVNGGVTALDGTLTTNFPTNSYSVKN